MSWHVHKFGGSSVGGLERLPAALGLVERAHREGPVVVVVSAPLDTTDWLLAAARRAEQGESVGAEEELARVVSLARSLGRAVLPAEGWAGFERALEELVGPVRRLLEGIGLVKECTPRVLDEVMSVGERISAELCSRALVARGLDALPVDARALVVTDDTPQRARVHVAETGERVRAAAKGWSGRVPVVTGYIGRSRAGHTTTLGRNGSDYTASLVAQALGGAEVTVWTDVPGVFTADPALVSDAYPVTRLTWFEALELAHFGTRMFHARTMVPLVESGASLTIRSTMEPDRPGTRIDAVGHTEDEQPTCVTSLERLALLAVESKRSSLPPGFTARALEGLKDEGIHVWMSNQTGLGVSACFVVSAEDLEAAQRVLTRQVDDDDVSLSQARAPVSMVTLVAERMGRRPNVAGHFFSALGNVGVRVRAIAQGASERSISCIVDAADTAVGVRTVHAAFNFAETEVHVGVLGRGTVGRSLLEQVQAHGAALRANHGVRLKVVYLADGRSAVFEPEGAEVGELLRRLESGSAGPRPDEVLTAMSRLSLPVLVDCTAADEMERLYRAAFAAGLHVVGANKKPLALPMRERDGLLQAAHRWSRAYLYETTCGASLPVIETLKNLVRTGDVVHRIEGALSGTLGFLADAVMQGTPLSKAVRVARERGLSEPHPRDDLSGLDVARKALILARELGVKLELDEVAVEPFVPSEDLEEDDAERFLARLERLDGPFAEKVEGYRRSGRVLRFLAQVERQGSGVVARVGPVAVEASHPAASLRGEEAMVAFTTERYRDYPLIVRGAGAGGAVTAAGVLADILRLAQNVRGRR